MKLLTTTGLLLLSLALVPTSLARGELPSQTTDGLQLVKGTKVAAVYMADGADLSQYDKIAMLKTYVAFKKNWKRDYNREVSSLEGRVSDKDMQRIRDRLAAEFARVFQEVLEKEGGHQFVKEGGDGVLVLRPAIIDLDVTRVDKMTPDVQTFTTSAGTMTLYMEMYDGKTGAKIAEVIDPEAASDNQWQISNSVTNKFEADRVIRRWATLLNKHLAEVKALPGKRTDD